MQLTFGDVYCFLFLVTFFSTAISWIFFARSSMTRIEQAMKTDGLPRPCSWDGVGARAIWMAWVIALPIGPFNVINDPSIDVPTVRKYANSKDKKRAIMLMVSGYSFVFIGLVGGAVLDYISN
ncbi:MAG: hypothetical protein P8176_16310 [Gammaproteobacteria bacterium]